MVLAFLFLASCGPRTVAASVPAPTGDATRVMVVFNTSDPDSVRLGKYYLQKRQIPKENAVLIDSPTQEEIPESVFHRDIEKPVYDALKASKNVIDFIVFCKGVPIRIKEGGYSVDAMIGARDLPFQQVGDEKSKFKVAPNPYFMKSAPFSHALYGFYAVTRLDGYDYDQARALVDRSIAAKTTKGPFLLNKAGNRTGGGYGALNEALQKADQVLKQKGFRTTLEDSGVFVAPTEELAGYCSWGSNDAKFSLENYHKLKFKPGAIAETFVSTSARTFRPTTGGQSLIADLIQQGVTGVKGYVSEPYTFALARPEILFDRYTSGFNLAESFYMASPVLKWKDTIIGDPLCSPYRG